jgi:hypothetical protein
MSKQKNTQKGFASLESLLLLVIVVMVAFTGWFVWHARSQANKTLNDTLSSGQSLASHNAKKKTATTAPVKKAATPNLINYSTTSAAEGLQVSSTADVDKLQGASDDFKDFIKDKIKKNGNSPSPCGNAYGIFVKKIYKDQFALGGEGQCGGAEKLWAKISDQWQEIGGTQQGFDCSLLEQYKVPSAIVEQCVKNGETVSNTQE